MMTNNYLTQILDFFLPRFCTSCNNKLLITENTVCNECLSKIKRAEPLFLQSEYERKFETKKIITAFSSQYIFEKDKELQKIIHALKYDKKFSVGKFLGENLGKEFSNQFKNWKINLIVPIPLHRLKKAERGFNQSYYIAKGISKTCKINMNASAVKRVRFTQSQTTMSLKEREENIDGAFKVKNKEKVKGKTILLIDDVMTTGATINESGKVLLRAGANQVYASTVAIANI